MGLKSFFMKKMLKSQLKKSGLPEAQQEKLIEAMLKNPQLVASMEVMKKYQNELREIMM
jgi:hypothetical protein